MKQICKVDKNQDLGYTIPDLAIDITEAVETGVVKNTPVSPNSYNEISEIDEVGSIVRDPFTASDQLKVMHTQLSEES